MEEAYKIMNSVEIPIVAQLSNFFVCLFLLLTQAHQTRMKRNESRHMPEKIRVAIGIGA
jgi:hypothetical protein